VVVSIDAGNRDPGEMAADITRPAEIATRQVPGVVQIRSTTSRGSAEIQLNFGWGANMVAALQATQGAMATILPDLPLGTRFSVIRSDPTVFPVLGLSLTSSNESTTQLAQFANLRLRPLLSSVPGVAGVDVLGGSAPEIEVEPDPAKLQVYGLTENDIADALAGENSVVGIGKIEDRHRLYLALVQDRVTSEADIASVPVKAGTGATAGVVTIGDVATVRRSAAPSWTRVTSNGTDAVLVNVRQTPTANAVSLVKDVQQRLKETALPSGVRVSYFYDQSELVTGAANAVRDAILLGALLAGIVLFLFLRSWRLMLITALLLPAVLAATSLALLALGMSFNMMTLGGMAASVGLVVDDAVVMLEFLMRRLQDAELEHATARPSILAAAKDMAKPLFGSTFATVVVFVPLAFISGVTGGFFKALAVTMVAALGVSLLYARFVLPLIADRWLTLKDAEAADKADSFLAAIKRNYSLIAKRAFDRPALFGGIACAALIVIGYLSWSHVESGFMPKMDEGGFILDYKAKPGAALTDTDRLLRQVETIIRQTPEVRSYSRRTGVQLGGGLTEADEGDFFIRLKGGRRRNIDAVMSDVANKVETQVPGLQIETAQLMEDLIGDLTAVPQPIEVKLFGDDPSQLADSAEKVANAISKIPGVVEVNNGLRVSGDAIAINVDRGAARMFGLDPAGIAAQLESQVGGTIATHVISGEQTINVRVRAPQDLRSRAAYVAALPLRSADGRTTTVGSIARISILAGQRQITREDLAPFIPVTARLEGKDLGSGIRDVRSTVSSLHLPSSIRVEYGGLYPQQKQSFRDLTTVFVAALLLCALLLTFLFENWAFTLAVISTVLISTSATFFGLWLTGIELDISAMMGLTMVVGMLTELSIFYLAELQSEHDVQPMSLLEAGEARLRPILMSALIAILTLLPLALGIGRGSGLQRPLATAIIFGLSLGALLILILLPMLVMLFSRALAIGARPKHQPQST
ncbi:MAG TPA: efflux RND transporter permease subunit, partial [Sphingomicrobium sp.]